MSEILPSTPLKPEDIGVGTLIWYSGSTSQGTWDCPAVIYRVVHGVFFVMSLDDMRKQLQPYGIVPSERAVTSRLTMRVASIAEVDAYLAKQGSTKRAVKIILEVQEPQPRIVMTRRPSDYHACWGGDQRIWAAGKNPNEAIGDLMRHHPDHTGIVVIEQ